ncbi:hypothetical protein GCM10018785_71470 [Streptomyces longispororuber]|uniref:Uncharacterized protein n=1 Tax=Streptomyces longispororuber TaxID=68230 RepID=A0A919AD73_9ACTN|nr:hypothetical protein [Streptomyces longispororuber]GHE96200.1 hypothetical protein GCM10018785_71470 [Streptomyces longispororuber]
MALCIFGEHPVSRADQLEDGSRRPLMTEESRIILFSTTVEEIRDEHLQALKDAVDMANQKEEKVRADYMAQKEAKDDDTARRKRDINAVIAELDFD